jgi:hypothetical protein
LVPHGRPLLLLLVSHDWELIDGLRLTVSLSMNRSLRDQTTMSHYVEIHDGESCCFTPTYSKDEQERSRWNSFHWR